MIKNRLIAVLGRGNDRLSNYYEETVYFFEKKESPKTPLIEYAIDQIFGPADPDELYLLSTKEVRERWKDSGLWEKLTNRADAKFEHIETGGNESVLSIFNSAKLVMGADVENEEELPERLLVDVTHGFRIQPLILIAALNFCISEWKRKKFSKTPEIQILYGAWDATSGGKTPIWDITSVLRASEWNSAIDAVMRYGRADDFQKLTQSESRQAVNQARSNGTKGEELRKYNSLKILGNNIKFFCDNLATGRLNDLITMTSNFCDDENLNFWKEKLPFIDSTIGTLQQHINSIQLADKNLFSKSGLEAIGNLIKYYGDIERFSEQVALLREGAIIHFATKVYEGNCANKIKGNEKFDSWRKEVEKRYNRFVKSGLKSTNKKWKKCAQCADKIQQLRNDVEHLGLNQNYRTSQEIRSALKNLSDEFEKIVAISPFTFNKSSSGFLNLSNHPISQWSEEQKQAAKNLRCGDLLEFPGGLPLIPANAKIADVEKIAETIFKEVNKLNIAAAYVAGEFTLTYILVSQLEASDVRCFVATADQSCNEVLQDDGSSSKQSVFKFVSWQSYFDKK